MSDYDWPPSDPDEANDWASEHPLDAIAYAAGWTSSGAGYGPVQARGEWPDNPGFDFTDGFPEYATDLKREQVRGFEYRTVLIAGDPYTKAPQKTDDGWELMASFGIGPEPELYDEDGDASGHMYIGEGNQEAVYRRWDEESYPGQSPEGHWTFIDLDDGEVYGPYPSKQLAAQDASAFRAEYPGTQTELHFESRPFHHPWDGAYSYFAYDPDKD